jgi:hypothetical protein
VKTHVLVHRIFCIKCKQNKFIFHFKDNGIRVFCINSDFPHPANSINWFVFVVEAECVFCEVRADF